MGKILSNTKVLDTKRSTVNTGSSIGWNTGAKYFTTGISTTSQGVINSTVSGAGAKFTFSIWVKRWQLTNPAGYEGELVNCVTSASTRPFQFKLNQSNHKLQLVLGGVAGTNIVTYTATRELFTTSYWYNIVVTYDQTIAVVNDRVKLYINNVPEPVTSSGTDYVSIQSTATAYEFGRRANGPAYGAFYYNRVSLWNNVLSQAEVTAIYNGGNPLNELVNSGDYVSSANLKILWKYKNAIWTTLWTITDESGLNNGTITSSGAVEADKYLISPD